MQSTFSEATLRKATLILLKAFLMMVSLRELTLI